MSRFFVPLVLAASALAVLPAAAQGPDLRPKIMVTGEGEARISPDMAIIALAVQREGETAREAMDENNAAMAAVIAALKEEGIEARDLQTSGLSIDPQYVYPNNNNGEEKPRITGYRVTNALTVRVRDLENVGEILDRSVSLGVNQGGNITFTNDDPSEALSQARTRAVEDAVAKARTLAEAAGVS
ncbi:SIMPL domain-containing protein, partial [Nitratireductor sp. GCM10026969]|uniref:SIMPL domain-containing protein n=1 Tax=Nitratireductor sp. GCM10026969 TaxID=3252645 RepID=UPI0036135535